MDGAPSGAAGTRATPSDCSSRNLVEPGSPVTAAADGLCLSFGLSRSLLLEVFVTSNRTLILPQAPKGQAGRWGCAATHALLGFRSTETTLEATGGRACVHRGEEQTDQPTVTGREGSGSRRGDHIGAAVEDATQERPREGRGSPPRTRERAPKARRGHACPRLYDPAVLNCFTPSAPTTRHWPRCLCSCAPLPGRLCRPHQLTSTPHRALLCSSFSREPSLTSLSLPHLPASVLCSSL